VSEMTRAPALCASPRYHARAAPLADCCVLSRAWSVKFVAGEWDNESDENVIESVTLTYDYFELNQ
jgi:hypothetical protein